MHTTASLDSRRPLVREFTFIFLAILGVIVPFGVFLLFFPTLTDFYWAWVIPQPRSALLIGAGYFGAIAYYVLALRGNDWSEVVPGLGGLVIFSVVLLVATMIHWDLFRPYHPITLVWLIFYYTGPFFVPIAYWAQVGRMPNAGAERGVEIAIGWRRWLLARGLIYVALALAGIVFAERLSGAWPWPIQPLELRVFVGQIAVVGWQAFSGLIYGWSWRSHRLTLILTAAIGLVQLLGIALGPGSYNLSAPLGILLPLMFAEWVLTAGALLAIYRKG